MIIQLNVMTDARINIAYTPSVIFISSSSSSRQKVDSLISDTPKMGSIKITSDRKERLGDDLERRLDLRLETR